MVKGLLEVQLCQKQKSLPLLREELAVARVLQVPRICRVQTRLPSGLRSGDMARPHPACGSCRYALDSTHAGPSYGQSVPKPIRHEHVVWEVHPENGEPDTRGFGDGSLRHGRVKGLVVLSEEMNVTAKLHGPLAGLHQNITVADCVAFSARQRAGRHLLHGLPERASVLDERPGVQHQRAVHLRVDLETSLGAHRRDRSTSRSGGIGEGPRDDAARARGHDLSVASCRRTSWRTSTRRKAVHPSVLQVEQSHSARASFLGWLDNLTSASRPREIQGLEQRQRRMLPGKLVMFQREPRKKIVTHTPSFRARTRWRRRASFVSAGGAGWTPHNG